jgi:hypothetical protein
VRLHEKGGTFHEMPCHHTLEGYLAEYMERARLAEAGRVPSSRPLRFGPTAAGRRSSTANGYTERMPGRWCAVAPRRPALPPKYWHHGLPGERGPLKKARQMAAHASTRTTQLYDRREDRVTLDEVINIRG